MKQFKGVLISLAMGLLVTACGSSNDSKPPTPAPTAGRLLLQLNESSTAIPLVNIPYTTAPLQAQQKQTGVTDATGQFKFDQAETVSFTLFGIQFNAIKAEAAIYTTALAQVYCSQLSTPPSDCAYTVNKNLQRLLLSTDDDSSTQTGIKILDAFASAPPIALEKSQDEFELALAKKLTPLGRQTVALFSPSVGINLEAPQPEADEVGGQPVAFVDLFRIARPFSEYSCTDITYDKNGWPIKIPSSCDTQAHSVLKIPSWATTFILRYVPYGAIPTGKYTVLYEGSGSIQYTGIATKLNAESTLGRDVIEITPDTIRSKATAGIRLQLKDIDEANPVKNIRIVMPGGICEGNPFVRVESDTDCPTGTYRSFVDTLAQNRNAVVFNPDYLRFLKDFKVLRTMNFMEASPRNPCYELKDEAYKTCLLQPFIWEQRATLDQASWGGSSRTPLLQRYARGVPLEVTVALANQLNRDPWFNIPHNATDTYVQEYATYVRDHLNPNLKAHLEYTNEPWNGIFWAALYVREKGKDLDTNAYRAGYKYYSARAVEIFNSWQTVFGGTDRLVRILNTYNPDEWMTRNMLSYNGNHQSVDVVASAPYFYGCWDRDNTACTDTTKIPLLVREATSVDDLFSIMDNVNDPYGISSTINLIKKQITAAKEFNVDFYTYEGGQHLTIDWADAELSTEKKNSLLDLIRAANRDARMGERYTQLLNGWKQAGGKLFMLYTLPQTYHKFGTFGLKEQLNQERVLAPKYDKTMEFQERQGTCWWENCQTNP